MASRFLINQAIQDANEIDQSVGIPAAGNNVPMNLQQYFSGTNTDDWRSNMNQLYNWGDSGARYNYDRPYQMDDVAGEVGEYSQQPGEGIIAADAVNREDSKFSFPNILNFARGAINRYNPLYEGSTNYNAALQGQVDAMNEANMLSGAGGKTGPYQIRSGALRDKNLVSMFGSNDLIDMYNDRIAEMDKTLANLEDQGWSPEELARKKGVFNQRKQNIITEKNKAIAAIGDGSAAVTTGGGAWSPNQAGAATLSQLQNPAGNYAAARARTSSRVGPGGQQKAYGLAQGGRAGYLNGELVGQETDFIEGPQGGEEFQETVVEGQEQPSREQLEALAMHIFQLPLEELDDQQLVVVYQAAMQGQPMEEAVQEEDVQFAAGGGRIGLRYGGLVSLL
tara:strand:- start:81 stop:1262 length:1182 start_codon:yes stop_codon:yes gene_type:complete